LILIFFFRNSTKLILRNSARRSGLWFEIRTLKNSIRDYWWCVHSKCHEIAYVFSLKSTYIVMNCHWLLIIGDTLITYQQKTWEVVFIIRLDLNRITYLFYNCLVLRSIGEKLEITFVFEKKSVGLFRWTKSLGTYYLKKNS
jgi:hypothetical protein